MVFSVTCYLESSNAITIYYRGYFQSIKAILVVWTLIEYYHLYLRNPNL